MRVRCWPTAAQNRCLLECQLLRGHHLLLSDLPAHPCETHRELIPGPPGAMTAGTSFSHRTRNSALNRRVGSASSNSSAFNPAAEAASMMIGTSSSRSSVSKNSPLQERSEERRVGKERR